jgi:hypothetical protein
MVAEEDVMVYVDPRNFVIILKDGGCAGQKDAKVKSVVLGVMDGLLAVLVLEILIAMMENAVKQEIHPAAYL